MYGQYLQKWRTSTKRILLSLPARQAQLKFRVAVSFRAFGVGNAFESAGKRTVASGSSGGVPGPGSSGVAWKWIDRYRCGCHLLKIGYTLRLVFKGSFRIKSQVITSTSGYLIKIWRYHSPGSVKGCVRYLCLFCFFHSIGGRREEGNLIWDLKDGTGYFTSVDIEDMKSFRLSGWYYYWWLVLGTVLLIRKVSRQTEPINTV